MSEPNRIETTTTNDLALLIADKARQLQQAVFKSFVGQAKTVEFAVIGLLSGLHVLVEDIPGVGKTTLALSLAKAAGLSFSRIQFTPDLLPGDVLGMNVWDATKHEFIYKAGPINAQFVLADEMNRASPRTQAAFLEAMQETATTLDGIRLPLPEPFMLFATQNPVNFGGTFPLPEAELDRFGLSFSLGYPTQDDEVTILSRWLPETPAARIKAVLGADDIKLARQAVANLHLAPEVRAYIVALIRATRQAEEVRLGASPRAAVYLQAAARTKALIQGRNFVIPEDVEAMAPAVLAHRLILSSQARLSGLTATRLVATMAAAVPKPSGL